MSQAKGKQTCNGKQQASERSDFFALLLQPGYSHGCCMIIQMRSFHQVPKALTSEKGETSGRRPRPMVASDHTTMKEMPPSSRAARRITHGLATHLYVIMCGCTGFMPAAHSSM